MAIIRTGHIVGGITGTLGSEDYVNGRGSTYVRRRPRKTNQNTQAQTNRRSRFGDVTQAWQTFPENVRTAWRAAAKLITFPNRLGIQRSISGFQLFVKYTMSFQSNLFIEPTGPPGLSTAPRATDLILTASASGSIEISFTNNVPPTILQIFFQGARPVSSSPRTHFSNYKFLRSDFFGAGPRSIDLTARFDALFGHPVENEFISVKMRSVEIIKLFSSWIDIRAQVTA